MKLLLVGCNYETAPIELREKLTFDGPKLPAALRELESRYGCEAVILSTCNRVELYLARAHDQPLPDTGVIAEYLSETHQVPVDQLLKQHPAGCGVAGAPGTPIAKPQATKTSGVNRRSSARNRRPGPCALQRTLVVRGDAPMTRAGCRAPRVRRPR